MWFAQQYKLHHQEEERRQQEWLQQQEKRLSIAFLAARACVLHHRETSSTAAAIAPSVVVSAALTVRDGRGGPDRFVTATFARVADLGCSWRLGDEARACAGMTITPADTWLPTAVIESWARSMLSSDPSMEHDSSSWRWSKSPSAAVSAVFWAEQHQQHDRGSDSYSNASAFSYAAPRRDAPPPIAIVHQSALCFNGHAARWSPFATGRPSVFGTLVRAVAACSGPDARVCLIDFDDDVFSAPMLFGGRCYVTVPQLTRAVRPALATAVGSKFRDVGLPGAGLPDGCDDYPSDWCVSVTPAQLAAACHLRVDEAADCLFRVERAALADAKAMQFLWSTMVDHEAVQALVSNSSMLARQRLRTPASIAAVQQALRTLGIDDEEAAATDTRPATDDNEARSRSERDSPYWCPAE